jgi:osmotically inducible lipoprotein OsmB
LEVNTTRKLIDVEHAIQGKGEMKERMMTTAVALCMLSLTACGTIVGGAVGAGSGAAIGAGTGYGAKKGALIGGGAGAAAGAVYDILR